MRASSRSRPALLSYTQSWYTLGSLARPAAALLALAPGESTRIAVIDWRRRTRAQTGEAVTEAEALTNSLVRHTRSLAEVTDAVSNEVQTGWARSEGAGGAVGYGLGTGAATLGDENGRASRASRSASRSEGVPRRLGLVGGEPRYPTPR